MAEKAGAKKLKQRRRDRRRTGALSAKIDRLGRREFLPEGRPEQPALPRQRILQPRAQPGETATAKIFQHGRSQAVRLPKEFRLPGKEARVRRVGNAVLLEPVAEPFDMAAWWAKLAEYRDIPFMPEGREQPPMPADDRKYFGDE